MAKVEFRYVGGGLTWATDDQFLENAFAQFGDIIKWKGQLDRRRRDQNHSNLALLTRDLLLSVSGFNVRYYYYMIEMIINDREIGRSWGFSFVTFKDEKSMRDKIEGMNGQDLDVQNITVNKA